MTDLDIFCNFNKCRKRLNVTAWITSCSHAFCEEHVSHVFNSDNENTCPACKNNLPNKYDVVKVDMNPSQQFRSMVLAGLRPEIIIDIAHRAISFWNYQIYMQQVYHEKRVQTSQENMSQMEQYYETLLAKLKTQLQSYTRKIESMKKMLEEQTAKGEELMDRINEKQRENNRIQAMYESLKRSQLNYVKENTAPHPKQKSGSLSESSKYVFGPRTMGEVRWVKHSSTHPPIVEPLEPKQNSQGFQFNPVTPSLEIRKKYTDPFYYVQKKMKV